MASIYCKLTKADFPTDKNGNRTKAAFLEKYRTDRHFRARAQYNGFQVLVGDNVVMPNGKIAGANVK